ncbi:CLUMA_CG001673, isoform A [Clunio marinus]|uniref:CLUMA_CG001673, isoform A n=1 Tax=Clunio marinus TaxID=568069 RepID=A0A1J1HN43_9DIPT|nr:CLUMA_CG001673, isoform A [Clunio marinus]
MYVFRLSSKKNHAVKIQQRIFRFDQTSEDQFLSVFSLPSRFLIGFDCLVTETRENVFVSLNFIVQFRETSSKVLKNVK